MTERTKEMNDILTKVGSELPPDVLAKMMEDAEIVADLLSSRQADPFLRVAFGEIGCYVGDIVAYLKLDEHEAFKDRSQGEVFRHIVYSIGAWIAAHPDKWWEYVENRAPDNVQELVTKLANEMGSTAGPEN